MPFSWASSRASATWRARAQGFVEGNRPALEPLGQVLAGDELEHEERLAVRLVEAVDRGDVRVVERGEQVRLAPEAREALFVPRELGRQHLDRDLAVELGVARAEHFAHPPGAEGGGDLVGPETLAGGEAHARRDSFGLSGKRRGFYRVPVTLGGRGPAARLLLSTGRGAHAAPWG